MANLKDFTHPTQTVPASELRRAVVKQLVTLCVGSPVCDFQRYLGTLTAVLVLRSTEQDLIQL